MSTPEPFIAAARRVLETEAEALRQLSLGLGDSFAQAVRVILAAEGRVVVSGMGKSGHVGHKIAATLASTGTPSFFVHPAEASHGDLGMITRHDVVLVLSNSGETPELSAIIEYSRRFRIPIIGVASKPDSSLIRQSDVAILLPEVREACPMGLAPTTSTTMTLALGDALAVALMEHREITPEAYRNYHPGGKLGARLLKTSDLMHRGDALPLVSPALSMREALLEITRKGFGVAGVVDEDQALAGIITDGDLRRHMSGLLDMTVRDVMTAEPKTISPAALAAEAVALMNEGKITALFVCAQDGSRQVLGLLHIHDCLRAGVV